jgi:hypothetical protein
LGPLVFFLFGSVGFNPTFNNISIISWRSVYIIGGENWWKPLTYQKSLTNVIGIYNKT